MAFKTLHTVTYPSEAHVIKLQLETKGIEVFLKDELMAQVSGVSQDLGGVKIQVPEEDYEKAGSTLVSLGYIDMKARNDGFLGSIDEFTKKIPIIKNWNFISRLIFFTIGVLVVFFALIYVLIPK